MSLIINPTKQCELCKFFASFQLNLYGLAAKSLIKTKLLRFFLLKSRVVRNIFKHTNITFVEYFYHRKGVTFRNAGTFSLTSSMEEIRVILK